MSRFLPVRRAPRARSCISTTLRDLLRMATISLPSLSPQRHKALRNLHPLYKRLSGESVWVFLEELGLDEAQCERFMDAFFRQMDHILSSMQVLEEQPQLSVRIMGTAEACCAHCAACTGRLLRAAGDPSCIALLPPYGIGCPLGLELVDGSDAPEMAAPAPQPVEDHSVLCAGLAADPAGGLQRYVEAVRRLPTPAGSGTE